MHDTDQSLGDQAPPVAVPSLAEAAVENILTLEKVMESARLVRRKAIICLRGDLEAEYESLRAELATLVDEDGVLVDVGEPALDDQRAARAQEIQLLMEKNRVARKAESYAVIFEAMPADEWAEFEKVNREGPGGPVKNARDYERKIIARCSIEPKFSESDVDQLRGKLSAPQMNRLFMMAFEACTQGGLDIPKSQPFSLSPRQ